MGTDWWTTESASIAILKSAKNTSNTVREADSVANGEENATNFIHSYVGTLDKGANVTTENVLMFTLELTRDPIQITGTENTQKIPKELKQDIENIPTISIVRIQIIENIPTIPLERIKGSVNSITSP